MSLDLLVYIFIGCVIYFFVLLNEGLVTNLRDFICIFKNYSMILGVTGDRVGLAITQSLTLTGLLQWGVRQRKY